MLWAAKTLSWAAKPDDYLGVGVGNAYLRVAPMPAAEGYAHDVERHDHGPRNQSDDDEPAIPLNDSRTTDDRDDDDCKDHAGTQLCEGCALQAICRARLVGTRRSSEHFWKLLTLRTHRE